MSKEEKTPMEEIIEKSHELMGYNNPDGSRSWGLKEEIIKLKQR